MEDAILELITGLPWLLLSLFIAIDTMNKNPVAAWFAAATGAAIGTIIMVKQMRR